MKKKWPESPIKRPLIIWLLSGGSWVQIPPGAPPKNLGFPRKSGVFYSPRNALLYETICSFSGNYANELAMISGRWRPEIGVRGADPGRPFQLEFKTAFSADAPSNRPRPLEGPRSPAGYRKTSQPEKRRLGGGLQRAGAVLPEGPAVGSEASQMGNPASQMSDKSFGRRSSVVAW